MPAASAISRMPASRPAASRGSPQGSIIARAERVPAQQPRLIDRAPERRAEARDRPARRREPGEPAEQGFVLVERDVVEEGVAAVEEPRDAAGLDVPRHAFRRVEVERALGVALARQRRDGEDAGESGSLIVSSDDQIARAHWAGRAGWCQARWLAPVICRRHCAVPSRIRPATAPALSGARQPQRRHQHRLEDERAGEHQQAAACSRRWRRAATPSSSVRRTRRGCRWR